MTQESIREVDRTINHLKDVEMVAKSNNSMTYWVNSIVPTIIDGIW